MPGAIRRVMVLGSTGSIGVQTLEVIEHLNSLHERGAFPFRHDVVGLAMGSNVARLVEQHRRFPGAALAVAHVDVRGLALSEGTRSFPGALLNAQHGPDAPERLVRGVECDLVVSAISGSAGLGATFAAVSQGRDIALANKETLVAAGALIVREAERSGSRLLPVDSEHAALWQCLESQGSGVTGRESGVRERAAPPMRVDESVERVWITSSGGPFRGRRPEDVHDATPEEALKHPTWMMGPKNTIDSATLMNKALEIIEAYWLFGVGASRIGVLIHPQSIVHSMVEFADGGLIAQLAAPDMRGPIQHALAWPRRAPGVCRRLNWAELSRLEFCPPDEAQSRAIGLAGRAIEAGGAAGAVLNGANEAAVRAFLDRRAPFGRIVTLVAAALDQVSAGPLRTIGDAAAAGARGGAFVEERLGSRT